MPLFDTLTPEEKEKWAGIDAQAAAERAERQAHPVPLSMSRIFWAVFWALWAFSLSAAVLVAAVRFIEMLATPIGAPAP
jgi:disulfide bond formation protein DsbB